MRCAWTNVGSIPTESAPGPKQYLLFWRAQGRERQRQQRRPCPSIGSQERPVKILRPLFPNPTRPGGLTSHGILFGRGDGSSTSFWKRSRRLAPDLDTHCCTNNHSTRGATGKCVTCLARERDVSMVRLARGEQALTYPVG